MLSDEDKKLVEDIGRMTLHGPLPTETVMKLHSIAVKALARATDLEDDLEYSRTAFDTISEDYEELKIEHDALRAKVAELEEEIETVTEINIRIGAQLDRFEQGIAAAQEQLEGLVCELPPPSEYTMDELRDMQHGELDSVSIVGQITWLILDELRVAPPKEEP